VLIRDVKYGYRKHTVFIGKIDLYGEYLMEQKENIFLTVCDRMFGVVCIPAVERVRLKYVKSCKIKLESESPCFARSFILLNKIWLSSCLLICVSLKFLSDQ
jgi:hypothetical protein